MVPDSDLPTQGYSLQMLLDDDTWLTVFQAPTDPNALSTMVYGLTTHKLYYFRAFAEDFNGLSQPSTLFQIYACGLPRFLQPAEYVWST
jgi:hypothetical protein